MKLVLQIAAGVDSRGSSFVVVEVVAVPASYHAIIDECDSFEGGHDERTGGVRPRAPVIRPEIRDHAGTVTSSRL